MSQIDRRSFIATGVGVAAASVLSTRAGAAITASKLAAAPDPDSYNRIASFIGEEMEKAWKGIMTKIVMADNEKDLGAKDGTLKSTDLDIFVSMLSGAQMNLDFQSNIPKPNTGWFRAAALSDVENAKRKAEVSVGIGIKF